MESFSNPLYLSNDCKIPYTKIAPRRRIDQFGVDQTDNGVFLLSSALFPTGVRVTYLSEQCLQNCGLDIVDVPAQKGRSNSQAAGHTDVASLKTEHARIHVVAFVEKLRGSKCAERRPDLTCGSTCEKRVPDSTYGSTCEKRVPDSTYGSTCEKRGPDLSNETAQFYESVLSHDNKIRVHSIRTNKKYHTRSHLNTKTNCPSVEKMTGGQTQISETVYNNTGMTRQTESVSSNHKTEKYFRKGSVPFHTFSPKVGQDLAIIYRNRANDRLTGYQWMSNDARKGKENRKDIRDPKYSNTHFQDERPPRYHTTSLPQIPKLSKSRPWTISKTHNSVTEPALALGGKSLFETINRSGIGQSGGQAQGKLQRKEFQSEVRICMFCSTTQQKSLENGLSQKDASVISITALRGLVNHEGIVHSGQSAQERWICCKCMEKLDKQIKGRSLKKENGKYRPLLCSKNIDYRTANMIPVSQDRKEKSVLSYLKYMDSFNSDPANTFIIKNSKSSLRKIGTQVPYPEDGDYIIPEPCTSPFSVTMTPEFSRSYDDGNVVSVCPAPNITRVSPHNAGDENCWRSSDFSIGNVEAEA